MNRRRFLQSVAAVFTLPAMPSFSLRSAVAAAPSAAVAVPKQARFWAIYISALHGECTPQTLQNMLHIPAVDAKKYIAQLVLDGTIKPNPFVQKTVSEFVKAKDDSLLDRIKQRLEKKAEARSHPLPEDNRQAIETQAIEADDSTDPDGTHAIEHAIETEELEELDPEIPDLELEDDASVAARSDDGIDEPFEHNSLNGENINQEEEAAQSASDKSSNSRPHPHLS